MPKRKPDATAAEPSRKSIRIANQVKSHNRGVHNDDEHPQPSRCEEHNVNGGARYPKQCERQHERKAIHNRDSKDTRAHTPFEPYSFLTNTPIEYAPIEFSTIIAIRHNQETYPAILLNEDLFETLQCTAESTTQAKHDKIRTSYMLEKLGAYENWNFAQISKIDQLKAGHEDNDCVVRRLVGAREMLERSRAGMVKEKDEIQANAAFFEKAHVEQLGFVAIDLEKLFIECKILDPTSKPLRAEEEDDVSEFERRYKIPEGDLGRLLQVLAPEHGEEAAKLDPAIVRQVEAKAELKVARANVVTVRDRIQREGSSDFDLEEGYNDDQSLTGTDIDALLLDRARKSTRDLIQAEKDVRRTEQNAREAGVKTESILEIPTDAACSEVS